MSAYTYLLRIFLVLLLILFIILFYYYWGKLSDEKKSQAIENEKAKYVANDENNFRILRNKEVFHIGNNQFTYDEAKQVCKSMDAQLATYDQIVDAYQKGAEWCNYGWSDNQMALFPTQKKTWEKLQNAPKKFREDCGSPGINGGYFNDTSLKFGVNCYGKKRNEPTGQYPKIDDYISRKTEYESKLQNHYRKQDFDVVPFNRKRWKAI